MIRTTWLVDGTQVDPLEPKCSEPGGHTWEPYELPRWRRGAFRLSAVISTVLTQRCKSCGLAQRDYYLIFDPKGRPVLNATEYLLCVHSD